MADINDIKNKPYNDNVVPTYVEVNFSNVCNLKCSYCSPQFSSTWAEEIMHKGAYPTVPPHNHPDHFSGRRRPIPNRETNPYVEAFWNWWPALYPHLKHFRMTGGEPILDRNTYRVFNYVLNFPNPDLHLDVTSNFNIDLETFSKYLDYVKNLTETTIEHFMQYVSMDTGVANHAEYIRNNLHAPTVFANVENFLWTVKKKSSLTFIITLNNLSILGLQNLLQHILTLRQKYSIDHQRVWFDTPVLRNPDWQSLQILPREYQGLLANTIAWMKLHQVSEHNPYDGFKDYEIQRLERSLAWMSEELDPNVLNKRRANFYRFFSEYDKRRNLSFIQTFPNMSDFWEECRYHAQTA